MADKLRTTYPHAITFVDGELPTGAKMSALSTQAKTGLGIVEKAIGDLWGSGGDSNVSSLHIPNLGRVVGANWHLNTPLFSLEEDFYYIEQLNEVNHEQSVGYLSFKPHEHNGNYEIVVADASSSWGTLVAEEKFVQNATDYWIDTSTGKFRFGTAFSNATDMYIGYWVNHQNWSTGKLLPAVIPDPRAIDTDTIYLSPPTGGSGTFSITLPYRSPLDTAGYAMPKRIPESCMIGTDDLNTTEGATALAGFGSVSGNKRLWSTSSADLFHRYKIPVISDLITGNIIPEGTICLCFGSERTVIEGLVFKKGADNATIEITDTAGLLQAKLTEISGLPAAQQNLFSIATVGSPVTKTLTALTNAIFNHTHTGASGEQNLIHSSFVGLAPTNIEAGILWDQSTLTNDDHIQYLHRDGDASRDRNKGAMLGDLIMAEVTYDSGNYIGDLSNFNSNRIYFGDNTGDSPQIYGAANDPFDGSFDNAGDRQTLFLRNSVRLGAHDTDHFLTAQTKNIKISADGGLIVSSDATAESSLNRDYHGGVTVSSYRPRLNFEDKTTNAYDFKMELDSNTFVIDCDFAGGNFASLAQSSRFIELTGAGTSLDSRIKFHKPITWVSEDQVDGNPSVAPDTRILAYYPHDLTVNDSGDNVSNLDGFRMLYQDEPFFHTASNRDYLVFEKTDTNASPPDGGIAFTRNDQAGTRKTNLIIHSDQLIVNADVGDAGNTESAAVYIKAESENALQANGRIVIDGVEPDSNFMVPFHATNGYALDARQGNIRVDDSIVADTSGLLASHIKGSVIVNRGFARTVKHQEISEGPTDASAPNPGDTLAWPMPVMSQTDIHDAVQDGYHFFVDSSTTADDQWYDILGYLGGTATNAAGLWVHPKRIMNLRDWNTGLSEPSTFCFLTSNADTGNGATYNSPVFLPLISPLNAVISAFIEAILSFGLSAEEVALIMGPLKNWKPEGQTVTVINHPESSNNLRIWPSIAQHGWHSLTEAVNASSNTDVEYRERLSIGQGNSYWGHWYDLTPGQSVTFLSIYDASKKKAWWVPEARS